MLTKIKAFISANHNLISIILGVALYTWDKDLGRLIITGGQL